MLSEDLRKKLIENMDNDPKSVLKELETNPQLLKALLSDQEQLKKTEEELKRERNERVKYIQMNSQMQERLRQRAEQLKTSQGLLIGVGLLWFLSKLDE